MCLNVPCCGNAFHDAQYFLEQGSLYERHLLADKHVLFLGKGATCICATGFLGSRRVARGFGPFTCPILQRFLTRDSVLSQLARFQSVSAFCLLRRAFCSAERRTYGGS